MSKFCDIPKMNVSEIMVSNIFSLNPDDTVAKALNLMHENNVNQIPIVDENNRYNGMIFAKDFLITNTTPVSKLKHLISTTPVLEPSDSIEKCTRMIVTTGKRALPVL